jgi:hypothetical protein
MQNMTIKRNIHVIIFVCATASISEDDLQIFYPKLFYVLPGMIKGIRMPLAAVLLCAFYSSHH